MNYYIANFFMNITAIIFNGKWYSGTYYVARYKSVVVSSWNMSISQITEQHLPIGPTYGHSSHANKEEGDNSNSDPNARSITIFKLASTIEETAGVRPTVGNLAQHPLIQVVVNV